MRRIALMASAVLALGLALTPATAQAGTASGSTVLMATPTAGQPLPVTVTLKGVYPIVPYDFTLENRCWFKGRYAGAADSYETYTLLGPWFDAGGGAAWSTETINLNDIPAGSVCKASVSRGGPTVKGTTTSYAVT